MRLLFIFVGLAVGSLLPLTTDAQTIRLKNGNSVEGEVEVLNDRQVTVDIPGLGKMTLGKDDVASIEDSDHEETQEAAEDPLLSPVTSNADSIRVKNGHTVEGKVAHPNEHYEQAQRYYAGRQYEAAKRKAMSRTEVPSRINTIQEMKAETASKHATSKKPIRSVIRTGESMDEAYCRQHPGGCEGGKPIRSPIKLGESADEAYCRKFPAECE